MWGGGDSCFKNIGGRRLQNVSPFIFWYFILMSTEVDVKNLTQQWYTATGHSTELIFHFVSVVQREILCV